MICMDENRWFSRALMLHYAHGSFKKYIETVRMCACAARDPARNIWRFPASSSWGVPQAR